MGTGFAFVGGVALGWLIHTMLLRMKGYKDGKGDKVVTINKWGVPR